MSMCFFKCTFQQRDLVHHLEIVKPMDKNCSFGRVCFSLFSLLTSDLIFSPQNHVSVFISPIFFLQNTLAIMERFCIYFLNTSPPRFNIKIKTSNRFHQSISTVNPDQTKLNQTKPFQTQENKKGLGHLCVLADDAARRSHFMLISC